MSKPTNVQKAIRETLRKLDKAEIAEHKAERHLFDCRNHRRFVQWRLRELEAIEEEVREYEQTDR